ncbi:MAG: major facilitator superfamily transporter [Candidatus Angelobacter sp.]|nr:major facilitator superfamily transporter [Candidatus Angelobacter sp.]
MRNILQHRGMRLIFAANLISMIGSGMNSAGVTWFLLQKTHSEMALGTLLMLQTIPALMMLPFTGVVIDREDRRRLLMVLDAVRGLVILWVAIQAYRGTATLWEVYLMAVIVAAGFWMFWPTITALVQELTPDSQFVHSNSFLLAGVQGGWLVAGAVVGFVYNKIGLHGVLFIDFASYVLSFICYLFVRKGKHTVAVADESIVHESAVAKFVHELKEGIAYIKLRPRLMLLGTAWALFIGGMLTQGVITAPFSDRILKSGAVGYGWLNAGWAIGAFLGAIYTPKLLRSHGHRRAIGVSMALLGISLIALPFLGSRIQGAFAISGSLMLGRALVVCVVVYCLMGCCRALGGVAITSTMMELVPKHFMGRVQNTFYFLGTLMQLAFSFVVGTVAHTRGLAQAFAIVGGIYLLACMAGSWPATEAAAEPSGRLEQET